MKISSLILSSVLMLSPLSSMKKGEPLEVGQIAPYFETQDVNGNTFNLASKKGKRVLLSFLRFAGCPVCNVRVHELIEAKPKFEAAGIELVLIYESGEEVLKTYTEDAQIPYVTISDSEQKLFDSYRVDKSFGKMLRTMTKKAPKAAMKEGKQLYGGNIPKADGSLTRIPADFLIDERGVLQKVHYGRFIGDHISFSEIFE